MQSSNVLICTSFTQISEPLGELILQQISSVELPHSGTLRQRPISLGIDLLAIPLCLLFPLQSAFASANCSLLLPEQHPKKLFAAVQLLEPVFQLLPSPGICCLAVWLCFTLELSNILQLPVSSISAFFLPLRFCFLSESCAQLLLV